MSHPFDYILIAVVFVTMISILVAAHELGHYLFARLFGMGVEEFAIGFGKKPLFRWMTRTYDLPLAPGEEPPAPSGEMVTQGPALEGGTQVHRYEVVETPKGKALRESTVFTVRPWPLGGFVRIKGMVPDEEGGETRIPGGFYRKSPFARFVVLLAGPVFSILAGILLLVPVYMTWGVDRNINEPVFGAVYEKGPAGRAGIKEGDRVLSIDGQPVSTFYQILEKVRTSPEKELTFQIQRGTETRVAKVTPRLDPFPTNIVGPDLELTPDMKQQGKINAQWEMRRVPLSLGAAVATAAYEPVKVFKNVAGLFVKPKRFTESVGGPATMVAATGQMITLGIDRVIILAAMLSISVGIMNLLPIPPLDGGQIVVAIAEMLRGGRRLSFRAQNLASAIGAAMVFALMIGAIAVDVKRFVEAPHKQQAMKKFLDSEK